MARITIILMHGGKEYNAAVDDSADPRAIAKKLAKGLSLPEDKEYRLALVDSSSITTGARLELVSVEKPPAAEIIGEITGER